MPSAPGAIRNRRQPAVVKPSPGQKVSWIAAALRAKSFLPSEVKIWRKYELGRASIWSNEWFPLLAGILVASLTTVLVGLSVRLIGHADGVPAPCQSIHVLLERSLGPYSGSAMSWGAPSESVSVSDVFLCSWTVSSGSVFSVAFAVTTALWAFRRWQKDRVLASFNTMFEDRRKTNAMIIGWPSLRGRVASATNVRMDPNARPEKRAQEIQEAFELAMFVFAEIDNLEALKLRYEQGFLDAFLVTRGCDVFISRCMDSAFAAAAVKQAGLGKYGLSMRKLVERLAKEAGYSGHVGK